MSRRPISVNLRLLFGVIVAGVALLVLALRPWQTRQSAAHEVQHLLGIKLPGSASDVRYWFEQTPGTYKAELIVRFELPEDELARLVKELRLAKANDASGRMLPTYWYAHSGATWWNPPKEQPERYYLSTNYVEITCVWHDGYAYILKEGAFGSPWR